LELNFLEFLAKFTADDPYPQGAKVREGVLWTNVSRCEISRRLREMVTPSSRHIALRLLKNIYFFKHKAHKKKVLGAHPDRNAQFENIVRLKERYLAVGDPVISIDTKKKELPGDFARDSHIHTQMPVDTLDHDFPSAGKGKLITHDIYDLARNEGAMHLNTSYDTRELCCGSNAANCHVFKEALQRLAMQLGLEIGIAHYPPYYSKHNPIEHRPFPHYPCLSGHRLSFTRHCQAIHGKGEDLQGVEGHGGHFEWRLQDGKKCATDFMENMRIVFNEYLSRCNYRAFPLEY